MVFQDHRLKIYYEYTDFNGDNIIDYYSNERHSDRLLKSDFLEVMKDSNINVLYKKETQSLSQLEKKIKNVINIFGLIDQYSPVSLKISLCIIALESLLVTNDYNNNRSISHELTAV